MKQLYKLHYLAILLGLLNPGSEARADIWLHEFTEQDLQAIEALIREEAPSDPEDRPFARYHVSADELIESDVLVDIGGGVNQCVPFSLTLYTSGDIFVRLQLADG